MTDEMRWQAVLNNESRYDGVFYYAVSSTGIFCRPSCCSRPPRRDRVRFFEARELPVAEVAAEAGFGSLPAFYRAFHRDIGTSPVEYRKKEHMMT